MSQLGIYGAVTKIAVVMTLFTQMYRLAAEPLFLSNFKKEEFVEMNAAAMKYFVMTSMLLFLGISLFRELFSHIVGVEFREGIYILLGCCANIFWACGSTSRYRGREDLLLSHSRAGGSSCGEPLFYRGGGIMVLRGHAL